MFSSNVFLDIRTTLLSLVAELPGRKSTAPNKQSNSYLLVQVENTVCSELQGATATNSLSVGVENLSHTVRKVQISEL